MFKKYSLSVYIAALVFIIIVGVGGCILYLLKNENRILTKKINSLSTQLVNNQKAPIQIPVVEKEMPSLVINNDQALFIADLLFSEKPWTKFTSDNGNVSFQYPENLFEEPQTYGDPHSGLRLNVQTQETWKKSAGTDLDGVSSGDLGDPDDIQFNWEKLQDRYIQALKDTNVVYPFAYEVRAVTQKVKTINNIQFLTGITMGVNGSCDLEYVTYQKNTKISFRADICDDPIFIKYRSFDDFKSKEVLAVAEKILDGLDLDAKTHIKVEAIERVIKTISVK